MNPDAFLARIIDPGLEELASLGGPSVNTTTRRLMLAIAMQESGPALRARYQNSPAVNAGPARGFWQFEQGGGVWGVLNHERSRDIAQIVCHHHAVVPQQAAVWRALEGHDALAVAFARLLLWTDPQPLPTAEQASWEYYLRNWRPGRPHPQRWATHWAVASAETLAPPATPLASHSAKPEVRDV